MLRFYVIKVQLFNMEANQDSYKEIWMKAMSKKINSLVNQEKSENGISVTDKIKLEEYKKRQDRMGNK